MAKVEKVVNRRSRRGAKPGERRGGRTKGTPNKIGLTGKYEKVEEQSKRGGRRAGSGRKKGIPNKISLTVKQAVLDTFAALGGVAHMTRWARKNPGEFYRIAARLIPQEVTGKGGGPIEGVITVRFV